MVLPDYLAIAGSVVNVFAGGVRIPKTLIFPPGGAVNSNVPRLPAVTGN